MSEDNAPAPVLVECGCYIESMVIDGVRQTVITACQLGEMCIVVQAAKAMVEDQGKPYTVIGGKS